MLPEITTEELSASLDAMVFELLDESRIDRPPVDAMAVARGLGVTVAVDSRQRGRARYVRLSGGRGRGPRATVLLRPDPRSERLQWALAHEIGEHVACRAFAALGVDPREAGPEARERVANQLAGRLLLPGAWFAADGAACSWDLGRLKARYSTASHELIARRMLELPPPIIITIFDHEQIYFRRSNLPGQVPPPSPAELGLWRAVHGRGRPREVRQETQRIQGWPVHEEGWKREILRAEADVEAMNVE
jgi:hypothetical protein